MKNNPMNQALRNRRMGGIDLTITIEPKEEDKEEQNALGLAPDAEPVDETESPEVPMNGAQVKGSMNEAVPNDKAALAPETSENPNEDDEATIQKMLMGSGLGRGSLLDRAMRARKK